VTKLPAWFRQDVPSKEVLAKLEHLRFWQVHTVCQEAKCPNLSYCFKHAKLTFLILGDTCTRNCGFCAVKKSRGNLKQDLDEPQRVAEAVSGLRLKYAVITSVTRDDLEDGGAGVFAQTIKIIHGLSLGIKVEILIPDFGGSASALEIVLEAHPDLVAHNMEIVKRLYPQLRPQADYARSLALLRKIKELNPDIATKSSLMLGLGETKEEIARAMEDLRLADCDILCLGQYLAPSTAHYPVKEFIGLETFEQYRSIGLSLGFKMVLSGPKVRSSYQAEEAFKEAVYA